MSFRYALGLKGLRVCDRRIVAVAVGVGVGVVVVVVVAAYSNDMMPMHIQTLELLFVDGVGMASFVSIGIITMM